MGCPEDSGARSWCWRPTSSSEDTRAPVVLDPLDQIPSLNSLKRDPGILGAKGSLYVTRQILFAHLKTREATQAMADDLFSAVASGQVKVRIDQRFRLDQVQAAHRALEATQTTGCTILP